MPTTNDVKETIEDKLKYIGLDLNNIPEFLYKFEPLNFRPLKGYDERTYKVYEYVPVKDIEILITPTNRDEDLNEKYKLAEPIFTYLNSEKEEYIRNYTVFLEMLRNLEVSKMEELDEFQKMVESIEPYEVKYKNNYLWQVYYSDYADKYFMLVPEKEYENSAMFYLIKKQIEAIKENKDIKIYIPISHMEYSEQLLSRDQIVDLENYLWLFTRDWPSIYEVYNNKDELSLQILGKTKVYEKISSTYKIKLENKKSASEFYNLIKALFILATDVPHQYKFVCNIDKYGNLQFLLNKEVITYTDMIEFLKNEVLNKTDCINKQKEKLSIISSNLQELKQESEDKNRIYNEKQKQIAAFLECKKSFFGRVRFFLKRKKKKDEEKIDTEKNIKQENEQKDILEQINNSSNTIEDLIFLCHKVDEYDRQINNIEMDIEALKVTLDSMNRKIENATKYIEEIEEHQKSFFEFMKFTNNDETQALTEGLFEEKESKKPTIKKSFDYEEDIEELGKTVDRLQREKLTSEECNAIFAIKYVPKMVKYLILGENEENAKQEFEKLKNEYLDRQEEYRYKDFDIFGAVLQDQTKIKILNNVKHREIERDKFEVLKISKNTEFDEYKENVRKYIEKIKNAYNKINAIIDMNAYKSASNPIVKWNLAICNINPYKEIEKLFNKEEQTIHLYKINIEKGMDIIFYSNIVYYDNKNETLPLRNEYFTRITN